MPEATGTAAARSGEVLSEAGAETLVHGSCFRTGPPRLLGVELEWLVHDLDDPRATVTPDRLEAAHASLPGLPVDALLTAEPGGQIELSSRPASSLTACVETMRADLAVVRSALRPHGLTLAGIGLDPWQSPRRFLREARYDAMERSLDRAGPAGRIMMCTSSSVQVNLDAGYEEPGPLGHVRRWQLSHLLGAVLLAAFAHSPAAEGRPTGWRSTRQLRWAEIGAERAGAPPLEAEPRAAWTRRALDAPLMCRRRTVGPWEVPEGTTFRDWLRRGAAGGSGPRREDLEYHLTTLFPPVRPRGFLELRMLDSQPGEDGWIVPLAVTAALFDDLAATETAYRAVKPLAERCRPLPAPHNPLWTGAARHALADPELREAAAVCFAAALEALPRLGAGTAVVDAVGEFTDRYVSRGRCPADDLLDRLRQGEEHAS
ncbi:ergothioneine biosynthesis glutamate--cysteine ligase EgtA [Streptomyces abyssomicinicus]|uniref:ergothioneine biosynthesis glutamate--cysteine ligase EgtA n=1 Tax=Streptomyces abyssomicinicus TaxID=574929 RepID=UPI0012507536|nr:ergothioneine biosynthesis glutamate--cysteine ligase EgtA [Streptomyces abyssomicinicus]